MNYDLCDLFWPNLHENCVISWEGHGWVSTCMIVFCINDGWLMENHGLGTHNGKMWAEIST